jgi:hypothetical protein
MRRCSAESDGGNAATILAHGIVIILAHSNQHIAMQNVPMTIPDPIWDVLQFHKDQFTYKGEVEPHPWRVPWMAR